MPDNTLSVGSTGSGKSFAAAHDLASRPDEAAVIFDPHKESIAALALTHVTGNVLFDRLSNTKQSLGYDLLTPSSNSDPEERAVENEQRAEAFVPILLRRRNQDGMASTPLMEEWVMAAIMLFLFQKRTKALALLPFAFMPGMKEFEELVKDCTLPEIRHKFRQLEKLNPRALRAEVGSAARLINAVFRSRAFIERSRGGFRLGSFLQNRGKLIVERGDGVGDDTMRVIMGAIVLLVVDHAKRRSKPYPIIRIYIDEATNAQLVGAPELRGIAETRKNGLFWHFLVQSLTFPGGPDDVLQNCKRHEWYGCAHYELARKAATDIVAGLERSEESRADRIADITDDIMQMGPGHRWVRDLDGSRKEYVPLLQHPFPDWPGLREAKLKQKIQCIYDRMEYRRPDEMTSWTFSTLETPPPVKSREDSFPAELLKRRARKRPDGSEKRDDENESTPEAS